MLFNQGQTIVAFEEVEARRMMSAVAMADSDLIEAPASHTGGVMVGMGDGSVRDSKGNWTLVVADAADLGGGERIEVESFHWGPTSTNADPDEGGELTADPDDGSEIGILLMKYKLERPAARG